MTGFEQEESTKATNGIVSIETQRRELELFYARLLSYSGRKGVSELLEDYQRIVMEYGSLDKRNQELVDQFDKDIIEVKVSIFLELLELEKSQ